MRVNCPRCYLVVSLELHDFPFNCRCGTRIGLLEDVQSLAQSRFDYLVVVVQSHDTLNNAMLVSTGTRKPRWISNQHRAEATRKLAGMVPNEVTAVAGVCRSGLSSAMQIAELRHLHAFAVSGDGELVRLAHGFRFRDPAPDDGTLLIVDDTLASGVSFRNLKASLDRKSLNRPILFGVTFCSLRGIGIVDLYAEKLELPHYLEWNFFNSVHSTRAALDFDGVLCRECRTEEDDDGEHYCQFLESAEPLNLPRRVPIPLIITARLERFRPQTEAWLTRWNIRWKRLEMGPWKSRRERQSGDVVKFKARLFEDSSLPIFVESCPRQARLIHELTRKTVICPTSVGGAENQPRWALQNQPF